MAHRGGERGQSRSLARILDDRNHETHGHGTPCPACRARNAAIRRLETGHEQGGGAHRRREEMSDRTRIVGVCLLRNEEYFAAWSLMNAAAFCDRVLVMDNRSGDRTREIAEAVAARHGHVDVFGVEDAYDTHKHVQDLAGTPTWVLGIDGDEIHDPVALAGLRARLLAGELDAYWRVDAHMLHVLGIDFDRREAFGYSQPEAAPNRNCYNFGAMESWRPGRHERLHGQKAIVFRPGYARDRVLEAWQQEGWDDAAARCLHMCFMPRSPLDAASPGAGEPIGRANPSERKKGRSLRRRVRDAVLRRLDHDRDLKRNYKNRYYAKGEIGTFDISGFGAPDDFRDVDPGCDNTLEAMRATTEAWARRRPAHPA